MEIDDENSQEVEEKPGAKLQRLRNELQNQIAKKKFQMWQSKSSKSVEKTSNEEDGVEYSKPDYEDTVDEILDDEDEEEMSESSEEDEIDSEEEEEKESKKKSDCIDEEAEESDIENEDIGIDEPNDGDKENERVEEFKINENSESTTTSEKEEVETFRKPLKRILKGFTEDSDDENDVIVPANTENEEKDDKRINGM